MKIKCTKMQQEYLIKLMLNDRNCIIECDSCESSCDECMRKNIEWEIEGGDNQ